MLILSRILGEAGCKHVIDITQGDDMITYVQHCKTYIQKTTSHKNKIIDWEGRILLYENHILYN